MTIYDPIVNELITLLQDNGGINFLEAAVVRAREAGIPQIETYGITSAKGFLSYANWLVTAWIPTESASGKDIYFILCIFYFVFSQPPLDKLQTPVTPASIGKPLTPLSNWMVNFARNIGKHLSQPGSLTPASLLTFQNSPTFHINECEMPKDGFKHFNDFFARKLKPGMRPIDGENDPNVVVFPADSTFDGAWKIESSAEVELKHLKWPIKALLDDSDYFKDFAGGTWMHSFLNTFDYHRQHAPVSGKVLEAKVIQGAAYLEVTLKQDPVTGTPTLKPGRRVRSPEERIKDVRSWDGLVSAPPAGYDPLNPTYGSTVEAPDSPGYQFLQTRGLITIDSPELGKVAILPIGMAQVSSVVLSVKEGDELKKGDEISYFQFGGSDIVLCFEKKANVSGFPPIDPPVHFNYGQKLATARPTK